MDLTDGMKDLLTHLVTHVGIDLHKNKLKMYNFYWILIDKYDEIYNIIDRFSH